MAFDPSDYVVAAAKPLPVILLLDKSGSMTGIPIQQLNEAVKEMISSFSDNETSEIEIQVAIITFGDKVKLHLPYTSASDIDLKPLTVDGMTPMGTAFRMAKDMIEDKNVTPSRAYRPTIILVSDGAPTDAWEGPLESFISGGRSSKCDRMAVAIGNADMSVLNRFVEGCEFPVFHAEDASKIKEKFKFITMSVTARSKSQNPNVVLKKEEVLNSNTIAAGAAAATISVKARTRSINPTGNAPKPSPQPSTSIDDEDDIF